MTGRGQLSSRVQAALDRLAWGVGDLKRVLIERGAWPAGTSVAVSTDGGRWAVTGGRLRKKTGGGKAVSLLVSESECLSGTVQFPPMLRKALNGAVEEALWRVSPLPPDQIVAAWRAEPDAAGGWTVQWSMCRRSARDQLLAQHGLREDAAVFLVRQGRALAVRNPAWQRQASRQRWMDGAGVLLLVVTLAALSLPALMPLVLKRQAVVRAVEHVNVLVPQAAPLREKMDELRRQASIAEDLRKNIASDLPLASVIDSLSAALPADTWLDRVEINGHEIRITGLTSNATELIAHMGRQPGLADIRATGANVRDGALNKERFTFEMRWKVEGAKP
ncbi:PilN domain-containing protein [Acidovorax sp. sic0104]|uniref:PilN domain-containing protein n=1 Tax=Acidovorax sp. sic0104 TaxID=2854784 RepID=UPI001C480817|nr:PilN domain-containing protein [Acidovorax sp. sic0104]MBV7540253.1 PilN domain-containing protein [Acidovorax sp. sic0104]